MSVIIKEGIYKDGRKVQELMEMWNTFSLLPSTDAGKTLVPNYLDRKKMKTKAFFFSRLTALKHASQSPDAMFSYKNCASGIEENEAIK